MVPGMALSKAFGFVLLLTGALELATATPVYHSSSSSSTHKSTSSSVSFKTTSTSTSTSSSSSTKTSTASLLTVDYNFETVMNGDPIAATNEIDEYNLLFFAMDIATTGIDGVVTAGLIVHSLPNAAAFSANTEVVTGTPIITADYEGSDISSFIPRSMYYGCVAATAVPTEAVPVSCNITVTAYDINNKLLGTQVFEFVSLGGLTQNQNFGAYSSTLQQDVYTLEFSVTNDLVTAALIDDFAATLNQGPVS